MDINRKVESFLTKHKYEKRKTSFTIILSVLIALCVISSLIMPAISMTMEEAQEQAAAVEEVMLLGEGEMPPPPAGALNIAGMDFLVSVNSSVSDKPIYSNYTYTDDSGVEHKVEDCGGTLDVEGRDSIDLSFAMQYSSSSVELPANGPHLYLDLTTLINVDPNIFLNSASKSGTVGDSDDAYLAFLREEQDQGKYSNIKDYEAGNFDISDGYVKITLNDAYIAYLKNGDGSLKGSLQFSGELHRSSNEDGDQSFTIGGQEIKVNFPDKYATLQKGDPQIDTTNGVVNWTVTISKEHGASLADYTLTDTVFGQSYFLADSVSYEPPGAGTYDGTKITFNDNAKNTGTVTIHYQTKITPEQINAGRLDNKAVLEKGDYKPDSSKTAWFTKEPISVDKTGTPDYQTSGGTYNNQIQWQIKITSEYGTTLNGCVIEDGKIPDSGWTISPEGAAIAKSGDEWTLSGVPEGTKDVTITYLAPVDANSGTSQSNTVNVTPPGGGTPVEDTGNVTYQQEKDMITPTKSGTYDADKHTITWTVEVRATNGYTLKGYELKDSKFTGTWTSSYCSYKGAQKSLSDITSFSGDTLTVTGDADYIQLKYEEVLTPTEFSGSNPAATQVANEFDIPKVSTTVTAKVDVTYRNTLTKTCLNGEKESSESEDPINKTLNWQADVTYDGKFADKEYVDVLIGDTEDGGTHTITDDQINAIVVRAAAGSVQGWEQPLTKGTDYTVERTTNGFKIVFSNNFDSQNQYNHVRINYSTTAQANVDFNNEPGKKISYTFSNDASFNGNNSGDKYEIERTNPVGIKTTDLQVAKQWETAQNPNDRPTVRMTILGKVKNSSDDYAVVRKDGSGNYLLKGDAGYESAADVTVEIGGGENDYAWLKVYATVEGLPIKETEKDSNGNLVTTEYVYKVQETQYKDKNGNWQSINGSYFEYGDGIYKIQSNSDYEVKNTYAADIDLGFKKEWSGNNLGITKVKVALYYQDENYQYVPVKKSGDTYIFNGKDRYGNSVSGEAAGVEVELSSDGTQGKLDKLLPASIVDANGQVRNCNYTLKEIGYYDTDNQWHDIDSSAYDVDTINGYFTISDPTAINYSGTLTMKNNGTADIAVTPQKTWTGDAKDNHGADNIQSITVALMRSQDGGTSWEKYGDSKTITSSNEWKADAWTNLPVYELVNGKKVTWQYKIVETHYTPVGGTETEIIGNQFILDGKGYYDKTDSQNINSDGTYVITNNFHDGGDMELKVTKNWWNNGSVSEASDRPTAIQVKIERMASNGTEWTSYPDEANCIYTMTPSSDNKWELSLQNIPRQSKNENGAIVTYIYRVTEVGYTASDGTHTITGNQFATTENGYYEIQYGNTVDTSRTDSGDTLSITNSYHPAETTKIIPQKVWAGDEKHPGNRPEAVKLQLQRQSQDADGTWSSWENVGDEIEISGTSDVATWNGAQTGDLPTKKITLNNGTIAVINYHYRLIETGYKLSGGDWQTVGNKLEFNANTNTTFGKYTITYGTAQDYEGKMAVTNTFVQDIGMEKDLTSENGVIDSVFDVEDLENAKSEKEEEREKSNIKCITIDGVKYYVFNWIIYYKSCEDLGNITIDQINGLLRPVSDKLPEGHTLVDEWSGSAVHSGGWNGRDVSYTDPFTIDNWEYYKYPLLIWTGTSGGLNHPKLKSGNTAKEAAEAAMVKGEDAYYYDANTQTIYFSQPDITNSTTHFYVAYSTKIKCDVLDAQVGDSNYTFSNLVQKHEEKTITPNGEPPEKVDVTIKQPSDLVRKSYQETLLPGVLQFSLHINPEGKNLSNGSTIDIEDIFKVTGYEDRCTVTSGPKNATDPNGKLVDTLMSNIVLYEVDVNGNKTKLPSSEYSMQFENGDSVNGGSALLKLTIPDEKHIYIEYTYKMIANENTPSVINGCWASQLVNGMRVKMQPGMVPPAGDIITFSNEAKLEADSATGEDSTDDTKYEVSESSGTISTNRLPKIYKVNTGDYTINDLQATFYLAKYENGKWYYATQIDDKYRLTWGKTGFEGAKVDPDALDINVQEAYQVVLGQNTLYKLVEISVPNGYAGSNLLNGNAAAFREMLLRYMNEGTTEYNGVDYSNFLTKYRHTNYFSYNSTISSYPEGITANQVMQIKSGDNIEIPNNELIDLSVSKQWIGSATEAEQADSSITVELYWSDKKVTTGMPDNAKLVDPADLGIQVPEGETFSATKTIPMAMLDGKQNIWTDLPNGLDSGTGNKPIYYYIKETAYTIGGKTYTLQSDGTFKTEAAEGETPEVGTYLPIYVGNAANTDTSITVKNTQKLMLQKEWKDANNNPLSENKIPDKILVSIYGVGENGAQTSTPIFSNVELKKTENWTKDITALLGSKQLNYKSYIAKEEVPEGETAQLNHYVISCVFNLNENSGDITITNKSNVPSSTSLEVRKQWNDGTEIHAEDSIHVSVWRSTEKIPDAELANLTTAVLEKYHAEKMVSPTGPAEEGQTLPSYEVDLNAANSWKYIWTDLAIEDESTTPAQKYYYYVYEDLGQSTIQDASSVNPDGTSKYQPSYTLNAQTNGKTTYTISNSRNSIVAQKVWYDENGKQIVNVYDEDGNLVEDNMSNLPPITLDVYKKTEVPEMLKIQTFGDSISQGSGWNESNETYASDAYLGTLLKSSDYGSFKNVTINNTSQGGQEISYLNGKSISDGDNIICIMFGTNNVLHNVKYGSDGNDTNDLQKMIKQLYSNQEVLKSKPIFLASIPYLNYTGDFAYSNQCGNTSSGNTLRDWGEEKKYGITGTTKEIEEQMNALVDNYNSYVGSVVRDLNIDGYKVYFVDVNSKIDKDEDYYDGCHLSKKGITKMAQAFAIAINGYYKSEKLGTITLNKDNNWMASCDIVGGSASDEYYVVETNVPTGWTKEITDAAGNIIPNDGSSNAQKAGSGTPITVANKRSIPKTALSVEKTWVNDNAATDSTNREKISLILQQSTDGETWVDTAIAMPTKTVDPTDENKWTYMYTDLPTQDINGNPYYYKIREEALDGYTTSYGEKDGLLAVEGTTGTLHVTNTRGISLTVNKVWMDENGEALTEGLPTAITVKIHRATSLDSVPDDVKNNLTLQVPATASVGVGKKVTVTANKNVTEVTSLNPEIATVTYDGNQITIHGVAEGTATITVTDGKTTEEITVTVSALEIYLDGAQTFTMVAGETGTLTAKKGSDTVSAEFTITEGANLVMLNGSTITANAAGNVTVKATTSEGLETTATIHISLPETFEISSNPSNTHEISIGDTLQLDVVNKYGATFTWSSSNPNVASVDSNTGLVTGLGEGNVTITAMRNGEPTDIATWDLSIVNATPLFTLTSGQSKTITGKSNIATISFKVECDTSVMDFYICATDWNFEHGATYNADGIKSVYQGGSNNVKVTFSNGILTYDISNYDKSAINVYNNNSNGNHDPNANNSTITVYSYTITYKNGTSETVKADAARSASRTAPQQVRAASGAAKEEVLPMLGAANTPVDFIDDVATITLSPTSGPDGEGWIYIVPDLPVYSGNAPYYYWVEEVSAGEGELSNYEVSYLFDDANNDTTYVIDAANPGNATATIRNTKTQNESYELPSTGGIGTRWYTIAGLFMLGGGCGGLATTHLIRRFRRRKCTK